MALIVLKRLNDAIADKDTILAVIKGGAINQDGRSNGLTAPNGLAQEAAIKQALQQANLKPEQISYVECHGTGTPIGDPIEVNALSNAYRAKKETIESPLLLGAVKTNLGHTEAASGIAGLIKVILALQHQKIPKNLHFKNPNPSINWNTNIKVITEATLWSKGKEPRRAGINSFGISGTNAHIIIEEAPELNTTTKQLHETRTNYLLPISAKDEKALQQYTALYLKFMEQKYKDKILTDNLYNTCYSASVRRSHLEYRAAFSFQNADELINQLKLFSNGETEIKGVAYADKKIDTSIQPIFVFSGQGSQQISMGKQLLATEKVFRTQIEACEKAFKPYVDWSLTDELKKGKKNTRLLDDIDIIQPALFAIELALANLWLSYGVEPKGVIGHSLGEVAAFCFSGALKLEDAAKIICTRSQLMKRIDGLGSMLLVGLSVEKTQEVIKQYQKSISIAASNDESTTIVSGEVKELKKIIYRARKQEYLL